MQTLGKGMLPTNKVIELKLLITDKQDDVKQDKII